MSAICGIFQLSGEPLPPHVLDPTMSAMQHYGRDEARTWQSGAVAFGHQMTHVTPQSFGECLPFEDKERQLVITSDARLDNRSELCTLLGIPETELSEYPDSRLILTAYLKWGEDCPKYLLGDFGFAILDIRRQLIYCARDVMGVRPLYIYSNTEYLCFASDLYALMRLPAVSTELDLRYVRTYLEKSLFYHREHTFYRDIKKLLPAHYFVASPSGIKTVSFWSTGKTPEIRYKREAEYVDHLLDLLRQAVQCRLSSAFQVGSHLSGGLDSSTVATLASRMIPEKDRPLHVFSWAPPPATDEYPLTDERAIIEEICSNEGMIPHYTVLQPVDLLNDQKVDMTTQPNLASLHERVVSRAAAGIGIRVLLSGWGGDEIPAFNGRGYFADLFLHLHWRTMIRELYLRARLQEWSVWDGLRTSVLLPLMPDFLLSVLRPKSWQLNPQLGLPDCLQPDFASKLNEVKLIEKKMPRERPGVRRNQIDLINNGHLTERMESWAVIGAASGIEYRYPLMDRRIIEYCLSVPGWLYFRNGWKRYMFRVATEQILPKFVQWGTRKTDPAMLQENRRYYLMAKDILADHIRMNFEDILSMGYVKPECLIDALNHIQEVDQSSQSTGNKKSVLWLANLREINSSTNQQ